MPAQCVMPLPAARSGLVSGLGVLTCEVGPELVDEVVDAAGCREQRRRLLPAGVAVYLVLGMCLFSGADSLVPPGYRSVLREMTHVLRQAAGGLALPVRQAVTRARQRLGPKVLQMLFERVCGPLAPASMAGAYAFGRRVVAWDGTSLDVPATAENIAAFGSHRGGCPQIRLVTLVECGTRALIGAAAGAFTKVSEQELARAVLGALRAGMLLLADRNFPGWELWGLAAATGADLVWRARNNQVFVRLCDLRDGSFLSVIPAPAEGQRLARARSRGTRQVSSPVPAGHQVRVIEYVITVTARDGSTRQELVRLITTLLDPRHAPAGQIAALYPQRWESENSNGEIKTRTVGAGFSLRSRTPDLAWQEMWACLVICQALAGLRTQAAARGGIDPDRISFTTALRVARSHVTSAPPPGGAELARASAITDLLTDLTGPRRNRRCQRIIRPKRSPYLLMSRTQERTPANITYTITITRTDRSPPAQTP